LQLFSLHMAGEGTRDAGSEWPAVSRAVTGAAQGMCTSREVECTVVTAAVSRVGRDCRGSAPIERHK